MGRLTKRRKEIIQKIEKSKKYSFEEAIALLQTLPRNFVESVDVNISLGVDASKSDQIIRGSTVLPYGTGKIVRVAVFAQGSNAIAAKKAGADIVGMDDLAHSITKGNIDFEVVIATPDSMDLVGSLGQILGPRGLMPNPKLGTVTYNIATAVCNAKSGQIRYRIDKTGIIHCTLGKTNFSSDALLGNFNALITDLRKAKPSSSKGIYFKKATVSTTMGPGLQIFI